MKKIFYLIVLVPILCSCAGNFYVTKQNTFSKTEKIEPDAARVVFLRPATGMAGAGFISIYDEDNLIGILPGKSFHSYNTKPGKHIFGFLFIYDFDFLHAELEGGKTYFVFCTRVDMFVKVVPKITAIKKDSDVMQKVDEWLSKLNQAELTDEGVAQLKVRSDKDGKYILATPGPGKVIRKDIALARELWLEKSKTTLKESLSVQDGV